MCQRAKRTSRAGSPLSKNYIGPELHAIKSLQKIKKKMKFCPVEGSVAWYKNRYQESTEAPVVGSDLNARIFSLLCFLVSLFCTLLPNYYRSTEYNNNFY